MTANAVAAWLDLLAELDAGGGHAQRADAEASHDRVHHRAGPDGVVGEALEQLALDLPPVQNAVDHAFPRDGAGPTQGRVFVRLARLDTELVIEVIDDGVGLPPGFTVESSKGLGLSIVQALVNGELGDSRGTHVRLRVPVAPSAPVEL